MKICISNPPFNLKWEPPIFAQIQERFQETCVPPENNANFAFVLTALQNCDRLCFILPSIVLTSSNKEEREIRKYLIEKNYIEAIITCPEKMFEATDTTVCIILFNKKKNTSKIVMIDATNFCEKEVREQKGQFGGKAHENRIYKKERNIFSDIQIDEIDKIIKEKKEVEKLSKIVSNEDVRENDFFLYPARYFDIVFEDKISRSYDDIVNDLNRIIKQKNCLKLTINEKIAKSIGVDKVLENMKERSKNQ